MNQYSTTGSHRTNAVITGVLYIIAAAASMVALKLYEPILFTADYPAAGAKNAQQVIAGALYELILVCSVAGTAIMLFPYMRRYNESLGLAYLCFRWLEAILILIGLLSVLSMVTLCQPYTQADTPDSTAFALSIAALKSLHDWTLILGPNFMLGINTFIYSIIFYHSGLIPKNISITGLAGSVLVFVAAILEMFGLVRQVSIAGALLAIPVFIYEMTLAVWLITKGFNKRSRILNRA